MTDCRLHAVTVAARVANEDADLDSSVRKTPLGADQGNATDDLVSWRYGGRQRPRFHRILPAPRNLTPVNTQKFTDADSGRVEKGPGRHRSKTARRLHGDLGHVILEGARVRDREHQAEYVNSGIPCRRGRTHVAHHRLLTHAAAEGSTVLWDGGNDQPGQFVESANPNLPDHMSDRGQRAASTYPRCDRCQRLHQRSVAPSKGRVKEV